ncbi:cilia- and flagella-associated protein 91 [Acipenser oxyrinchus oxyrinchus]|uniref:Cilia- and flagella-associated protein 91 n=1 Tax=Acipenser oxyrinchus oxyrinchus TaxID=40147 RepID=A0AAD8DF66_ACIOX|nr:cilia- and flagella-associated protein 91 [Acipenser oxyrinchus oxyrinchus]
MTTRLQEAHLEVLKKLFKQCEDKQQEANTKCLDNQDRNSERCVVKSRFLSTFEGRGRERTCSNLLAETLKRTSHSEYVRQSQRKHLLAAHRIVHAATETSQGVTETLDSPATSAAGKVLEEMLTQTETDSEPSWKDCLQHRT